MSTETTPLIPTTKRDAKRRYNAGRRIGASNESGPCDPRYRGFTRDELGWTWDYLVDVSTDSRRPSALYWYRPADES